jgi:hypothetical protein
VYSCLDLVILPAHFYAFSAPLIGRRQGEDRAYPPFVQLFDWVETCSIIKQKVKKVLLLDKIQEELSEK